MLIASLAALFLAGRAHGDRSISAAPMQKDHIADLARRAHAGDIAIIGMGERNREPRPVVDVDAAGCSVAFKTAISTAGFRAQIADFSRDLIIEMVSSNEVQVIYKRDPSQGFTLRSRRGDTSLHDELRGIQEVCRAANMLF
ncbi:hypothetical protein M527_11385 [Sphingobium indicum IP26]|uniref:Uncharacterized protein n=1 Tax=Sphingobium indicum F2 TaxID=1450518 RepID=A0A8E1C2E0_9SPHN|nr:MULTISPECIES: hypothetical protein [Sphingobium]EPR18763.1 hypothetical protein M527_11385 [Sphingobium indicum IP26]EQB00353.1 hypothetical protein L286_17870 [Sphingobium sp. HDIP04]KER36084.1 hypothetical protein AL00_12575 [Sphingobium indicum F2]